MKVFEQGWRVAALLAVVTIVEYIFALNVGNDQVRFIGLGVAAVAKAGMIGAYFMHFMRMFEHAEAH